MSLIYHNIIGIEEIYRYMSISVYKLSVYRGYTVVSGGAVDLRLISADTMP